MVDSDARNRGLELENAQLRSSLEGLEAELRTLRGEHDAHLRESEERFRTVFEKAGIGKLITSLDGRFLQVNPAFCEMLGYPAAELIGRPFREVTHPDDRGLSDGQMRGLLAGELERASFEKRYLRKDGETLHVLVNVALLRDAEREPVHFIASALDISKLKQVEHRLRASEALLQGVLDNVQDAYIRADIQGALVMASPSAARMYGFGSPAEMLGIPVEALYADRLERAAILEEMQRRGHVQDRIGLGRRKDGSTIWISLNAQLLRDEGGRFIGTEGFVRDITDRIAAEEEREKLAEQLRTGQKMEAIGRLAGGVAHDFNNLLSVILTYTGFAIQSLPDGSASREDLLAVKRAGERAAEVTRQLLAFSRKQVMVVEPLDLNKVAARLEKMLTRFLGEDVELVQVLGPDLWFVRADRGQVEQVIMNLAINAREAMPDGGKLTILTANFRLDPRGAENHLELPPGEYVLLSVSDTGCGICEETRGRIFEPFFTTKSKGTGLGLATVYGIVKQSGGEISVSSDPGRGATFTVYLPRTTERKAKATQVHPAVSPARGTETILVVDDEEMLCKAAQRVLEGAGYRLLTAADADSALGVAARHQGPIHLLLTDVIMPRKSGKELARELLSSRPATRVLFMSGYINDEIFRDGFLEKGMHFVPKPFGAADLMRKVREVLDGGEAPARDSVEAPALEEREQAAIAVDRGDVATLPRELVGRLREAVVAARFDEIIEIIEVLEDLDGAVPGLAAGIRRMAEGFDYEGLKRLLGD
jgi:two-component system, cell cycle sensor histidine kinase and response regulator CckA